MKNLTTQQTNTLFALWYINFDFSEASVEALKEYDSEEPVVKLGSKTTVRPFNELLALAAKAGIVPNKFELPALKAYHKFSLANQTEDTIQYQRAMVVLNWFVKESANEDYSQEALEAFFTSHEGFVPDFYCVPSQRLLGERPDYIKLVIAHYRAETAGKEVAKEYGVKLGKAYGLSYLGLNQ